MNAMIGFRDFSGGIADCRGVRRPPILAPSQQELYRQIVGRICQAARAGARRRRRTPRSRRWFRLSSRQGDPVREGRLARLAGCRATERPTASSGNDVTSGDFTMWRIDTELCNPILSEFRIAADEPQNKLDHRAKGVSGSASTNGHVSREMFSIYSTLTPGAPRKRLHDSFSRRKHRKSFIPIHRSCP